MWRRQCTSGCVGLTLTLTLTLTLCLRVAQALYVGLHNIRTLQRSRLPVEVFHVGAAEAFAEEAAARLRGLGGVAIVDLLSRLHPAVRDAAATRLRSFAAKAFAMLACSFDVAILVDANALFFQPPEALLRLRLLLLASTAADRALTRTCV